MIPGPTFPSQDTISLERTRWQLLNKTEYSSIVYLREFSDEQLYDLLRSIQDNLRSAGITLGINEIYRLADSDGPTFEYRVNDRLHFVITPAVIQGVLVMSEQIVLDKETLGKIAEDIKLLSVTFHAIRQMNEDGRKFDLPEDLK